MELFEDGDKGEEQKMEVVLVEDGGRGGGEEKKMEDELEKG